MKKWIFLVGFCVVTFMIDVWAGEARLKIPFSKPSTLATGAYSFRFSLWDAKVQGTELWNEEKDLEVDDDQVIATQLGDALEPAKTSGPLRELNFSQVLWVQVDQVLDGGNKSIGERTTLIDMPKGSPSTKGSSSVQAGSAPNLTSSSAIGAGAEGMKATKETQKSAEAENLAPIMAEGDDNEGPAASWVDPSSAQGNVSKLQGKAAAASLFSHFWNFLKRLFGLDDDDDDYHGTGTTPYGTPTPTPKDMGPETNDPLPCACAPTSGDYLLDALDKDTTCGSAKLEGPGWVKNVWPRALKGSTHYVTRVSEDGKETANFTPNLRKAGQYEIWVGWRGTENRTSAASFYVIHKGGTTHYKVNQRPSYGYGMRWQKLGVHEFEAGKKGQIILKNERKQDSESIDGVAFANGPAADVDSEKFLWTPKSAADGNLEIHLPASVDASKLTIQGEDGTFIDREQGNRQAFRFSKPGSSYGTNITIRATLTEGGTKAWTVPDGTSRHQQ